MKIDINQIKCLVTSYVIDELIPAMPNGFAKWAAGGIAATGSWCTPQILDKLKMLGLFDGACVDTDMLETFMAGAFKSQPNLHIPALGVTVTQQDGIHFLNKLKGITQ